MVSSAPTGIATGEWVSKREHETFALGVKVGQALLGGEILLLSGPLGAGKTVFVKGIANALGIDEQEVSSPSFTLVNPHRGRLLLYHVDLFRLDQGASAAHAVDLEELLADERAVIVIEWAERLGRYTLPSTVWQVSITGDGADPRKVSIKERSIADRSVIPG